jgi:anti-sigma regulatory factor (Ser/Thr protein kinase)
MMIHELCTNSIKYGALSADKGEIGISWSIDDRGSLMLIWEEQGGPSGDGTRARRHRQHGHRRRRPAARRRDIPGVETLRLRCIFLCSASALKG